MKKISGYIISVFLLVSTLCSAQDSIRYPINAMKGIRIGADVSKIPVLFIYDFERIGVEATIDMHIKDNIFATAEAGWLKVDLKKSDSVSYQYASSGFYGKAGADYNLLKSRRPFSNDIVYAGARYAIAKYSHQADSISFPGHFWPNVEGLTMPKNTLQTHWVELLLGVKAEVLKNLYVGLTFRFKFMLISPKDDYSTPYLIPGYGSGAERFAIGINYYVSYNIHF